MKKKKKVEDIFKYRDMSPQKKKAVSLGGIIAIGITTVAIGLRMKGGLCKWFFLSLLIIQMMTMIFGLMTPF